MNDLIYKLAPAGATHHIQGYYRRHESGDWYDWKYGSWVVGWGSQAGRFEPIPSREIELNRLADGALNVSKANIGNLKTWQLMPEEIEERREIRIKYGLIDSENNDADVVEIARVCECCGALIDDQN